MSPFPPSPSLQVHANTSTPLRDTKGGASPIFEELDPEEAGPGELDRELDRELDLGELASEV